MACRRCIPNWSRRPCSTICTASIPDRIVNKTNGITFRRWLFEANPGLTRLLGRHHRRSRARRSDGAESAANLRRRISISRARSPPRGKPTRTRSRQVIADRLADQGRSRPRCSTCRSSASTNTSVNCSTFWRPSRSTTTSAPNPTRDFVPRVKIFAGKAAASYHQAKLIIKLANDVAQRRQQRSDGARSAEDRVPAELQCQPRRDRSFPPPICPSRFRRRAWRRRAPAI